MFKRFSFVIVMVLIAACSIAGTAAPVKLTFAFWGDGVRAEYFKELIAEYEAMNPHVEIDVFYTAWADYHDQLLTMAIGGIAPDIAVVQRAYIAPFAEEGLIRPLDDLIAAEPDLQPLEEHIHPVFLRSAMYQGKFYGFPIWSSVGVIGFNRELFDSYGVPTPELQDWTWESFADTARRLTHDLNGDGNNDIWGLHQLGELDLEWACFGWMAGGRFWNEDKTEVASEADYLRLAQGLDFWSRLAHELNVCPTPLPWVHIETGRSAMAFQWHSWFSGVRSRSGLDIDITQLPAGPAGLVHVAGSNPITISPTTPHLDEAYAFVKWFVQESRFWEHPDHLSVPVFNSEIPDYFAIISQEFKNVMSISMALDTGRPEVNVGVVDFATAERILTKYIEEIRMGRMSATEGALNIHRELKAHF